MTNGGSFNYQRYLASREWAVLKEQVLQRSGGTCERCRQRPHQNTHHQTYERIGRELLGDLLGLCRPCHEYLSGKRNDDPAATGTNKPEYVALVIPRGDDLSCIPRIIDEVIRVVLKHQADDGVPVKLQYVTPVCGWAQFTITTRNTGVNPGTRFLEDAMSLLGAPNVFVHPAT